MAVPRSHANSASRGPYNTRPVLRCTLLAFAFLFLPVLAWAGTGGSISGVVTDTSGAVVSGATVTATNTSTTMVYTSTTNSLGTYAFPSLPIGHYDLEIASPGFKQYRRTHIVLDANSALAFDAVLNVGEHAETIMVSAETVQVETSSTQMEEVVSGHEMTALPLNGRSFTDLLALQPGILPISSTPSNAIVMSGLTSTPPSGDLDAGNLSVNGQRETANGFAVNGSDVEEDVNMGIAIVPNLDSIAGFRVLTSNFDAQYGNFSGGQVLVTTKSGTSQFHGDLFEFLRNTSLDARNYFSPSRAAFHRNQFGGTFGGPLSKQMLFFFVDYQGTRTTQGIDTGLISVPSARERVGDLSGVSGLLTGNVDGAYWANQLSQQLGHPVQAGEPYYTTGCTNPSQCVFPNAQVPQSAWSAPARALLQYIPRPNQGTDLFDTSAQQEKLRDDKGAAHIDAKARWGTLSAYYLADDYWLDNPYPTAQGGANVPGFNALSRGRAQLVSLGLTSTFAATAINEFHFSYMRNANTIGQPIGGVGPTLASQGFVNGAGTPGIVPLAPKIEGIENVAFNDFTLGVDITGLTQAENIFQWSDGLTKMVGHHTFMMGGAFHLDQINVLPDTTFNGSFAFHGSETGLDFADFLLGIASTYAQADSGGFYPRNHYAGVFCQDSWQIKPSLTLNYGLRWDLLPPWSEKYNQFPGLVLGEQSVVYPGAPRGLVFVGDHGVPATIAPTKYSNFAPRLGLAFSPSSQAGLRGKLFGGPGKTSVRAGFGIFYTAFEGTSAGIQSSNPPYGYDYTSPAPVLFTAPFIVAASGQKIGQPFPSPIPVFGASPDHPNTTVEWTKYLPITGVPAFSHNNVPPYSESYTLSIERQLGGNSVFSMGYSGAQDHHLLVLVPANPGNAALCMSVSQPSQVMPGTSTCGPFSEGGTFIQSNGQTITVRGPFSAQFNAITYQKTMGWSNYNSLEISLRHQSRSLELMAGYTYSKSIDDSSSLAEEVNPVDPLLSKAISAFDMRHNFVFSYSYNLPIDGLLHQKDRYTEGWVLTGSTRYTSGLPVTLYNNNDTSLLGSIPNGINNNGVDSLDYTPGALEINTDPRNGRPEFNTALFKLPSLGKMGDTRRRFFYGPGMDNYDMALLKAVPVNGSRSMQFRLEAFNVFNHAQFFGPQAVDGNISDTNFGQVVCAAPPRIMQVAAKFIF
ncbi:MAG: carboxypeptidase regulatory-like domain-containing protein [Acidobacteriaceae bacterium]